MDVTRTEYGPSLPALVRPWWGRLARPRRLLFAGAAIALLALAIAAYLLLRPTSFSYSGSAAPAFSLDYGDGLKRIAPGRGELLRLQDGTGEAFRHRFEVLPIRLAERRGELSARLPLDVIPAIRQVAGAVPGFREALEGMTRTGVEQGQRAYEVAFTAPDRSHAGATLIGKLVLVPAPGADPRRGVALVLLQSEDRGKLLRTALTEPADFFLLSWPIRPPDIAPATAVDTSGSLEQPLRSFSFD